MDERIGYRDIPEGMFEKLLDQENFINCSGLERNLLELVRLRVAQLNGCAYCVDMHYKELRHMEETELRLSGLCIWEATPYFSEKERLVLKFTERLTVLNDSYLSHNLAEPLYATFSKADIAFWTLAVAQINTWTRLMKVFRFKPGKYQVSKD